MRASLFVLLSFFILAWMFAGAVAITGYQMGVDYVMAELWSAVPLLTAGFVWLSVLWVAIGEWVRRQL